jgi:hypothetical protein
MPETDLDDLKKLERSCLNNAGNGAETWGLFSNHDELFGGSGYGDLYESIYGQERLRRMNSPHRISETAIGENLMPVIREKIENGDVGGDWLKNYTVSELEKMAILSGTDKRELLNDILSVRQEKLNSNFVFTPENIEKILWIDKQLKDCLNSLLQEGTRIVRRLNCEMKKKDTFFNDYEIEALVCPVITEWNEEAQAMCESENEIYDLLNGRSYCDNNALVRFDPRHSRDECYFGDLNWNRMIGARNGEFEKYHIGYAMHELYSHSFWSLPDIVKINGFDATIHVEYQHY